MKPRKLLAVAAGNNKFLSTNVKGESLLYDGTAFVLFGFFFEQMNGSTAYITIRSIFLSYHSHAKKTLVASIFGYSFTKVYLSIYHSFDLL